MPTLSGPTISANLRAPVETLPASPSRSDPLPVTRPDAPAVIVPRPPDQVKMGLVQAALLGNDVSPKYYSPQGVLKPWGITIRPNSERAREHREADMERERQATFAPRNQNRMVARTWPAPSPRRP
ncbi:hypothetical protein MBELCI_2184 [Limimaricola cinnabarinus LL-001]|uniref:Uncharacterized protein n=2 Tax=Limimaricola cinnabarinus TaxID=1125964 RepID=U2Z4X2_9RHOB|nr:hypothetical protein MBELCI_2184 [Limimaricola cinnabarinus LL-001]